MRKLTPKQERLIEIHEEYARKYGYPPTIRELAEILGVKSSAGVHEQLRWIAKKGYSLARKVHKGSSLDKAVSLSSGVVVPRRHQFQAITGKDWLETIENWANEAADRGDSELARVLLIEAEKRKVP